MGHFYFLLALAAIALVFFGLELRRRLARRFRFPFVADTLLFSPERRAFLPVLERAVGRGFRVYGRVRAADVIGLRRHLDRGTRRRAEERLGGRVFDFLICTAGTGVIACAVSLAPRSRLGRRPPRDDLDRICAAAGLPFVRFRQSEVYSVVDVEDGVFRAMQALGVDPKALDRVRVQEPAKRPARPSPETRPATQVEIHPDDREALDDLATAIRIDRKDGAETGGVSGAPSSPTTADGMGRIGIGGIGRIGRGLRAARSALASAAPPRATVAGTPSGRLKPPAEPAVHRPARAQANLSELAPMRPRKEPVLVGQGDIDDGPVFTIRDDAVVEDDRPTRLRRA